jgi:hypothetical protein
MPTADDIGDEGVVAPDDRRFADRGMAKDHDLDLARLHPEPAHLHLVVEPAQELQLTVAQRGELHVWAARCVSQVAPSTRGRRR